MDTDNSLLLIQCLIPWSQKALLNILFLKFVPDPPSGIPTGPPELSVTKVSVQHQFSPDENSFLRFWCLSMIVEYRPSVTIYLITHRDEQKEENKKIPHNCSSAFLLQMEFKGSMVHLLTFHFPTQIINTFYGPKDTSQMAQKVWTYRFEKTCVAHIPFASPNSLQQHNALYQ